MNIAFWCVLAAGVMPVATVAIAKAGARYNNYTPRDWLDKQVGFRKRAHAAHLNHFEAFPFFAAGVIIAYLAHVPQGSIDAFALAFIAARVIYTAMYLTDKAALRSVVWFIGYACVIAQFVHAGMAS